MGHQRASPTTGGGVVVWAIGDQRWKSATRLCAVITAGPCAWLQESIDDASIWFADGRLGDWALLVNRVAGVGVLHRVPRDCRRLFACSC